MFKKGRIALYLVVILLITGCSNHSKLVKSTDNDLKYEAAIAYYNKKDYYRALQLFEQLNAVYRGTARGERITYYQAFCYYEQDDYLLAGYYFELFAKSFPMNKDAEECSFMSALCTSKQSPKYSLDQTKTKEAIEGFQYFMNRFPNSNRKDECNRIVDELVKKLAKKDFEIAKLYYHTMEYEAAVVCFENLMNEYPNTEFAEESNFSIVRSYYHFAINSIHSKKKERYQKCLDAYYDFVANYPDSKFMKDATKLKNLATLAVEKIDHPKQRKNQKKHSEQENSVIKQQS
ncbi:MAG: outer membrane protein assembly factor BamD [Bacteroidales bacterium]|nr:outer membrane protein assembly factor BamD [Bacteroidales bacterium]